MSQGIFVADSAQNFRQLKAQHDSRRGRMNVDLTRDPKHLRLLDDFSGGTSLAAIFGVEVREVLHRVEHHLPYTPEVYGYFYVKSYDGNPAHAFAGYYSGQVYMYSRFVFTFTNDQIFFEVDDKEVRIVHSLFDGFGDPYNSDANKYIFRVKYYIMSIDSHLPSYSYKDVEF